MIEVEQQSKQPNIVPNYMASSLRDVDFRVLKKAGIKYVALDADSTLVKYRGTKIDKKTREYLIQQKKHIKGWCIASNRITNDLGNISADIDAPIVGTNLFARKPKKHYFRRVISFFDAKPSEIVMIGDKLIADVWGGNRMGMATVWVERLGDDGLHDRALRVRSWEQFWMRKYINKHNG